MTAYVNGLNFRSNIFGDGEVTKINVEQVIEMKKQRLLEKENDNNNEILINNLCDIKCNYDKTKLNLSSNTNALCGCWYLYNEFIPIEIQESMKADGNKEISIFNKYAMNRYRLFLNENKDSKKFSDSVTWELFSKKDSVNRFICELSETEITEMMDENVALKISNEKWAILKKYFDNLKTYSNDYLLEILSRLCKSAISSFSINTCDLALLYGLHNLKIEGSPTHTLKSDSKLNRPIIYVVKCKCSTDFLLIPALFKETGIDSPVFFVGETKQVVRMKSILTRIGYIIVENNVDIKYPKMQSFIVEKKATMILESQRSICLVINESINSYCSASGGQTELRVLHSAVTAFIDGCLDEPIIVPISLSHEITPRQFLPRANSLWSSNTAMITRMLTGHFGIVKLSFSKPIYYSQFSSNIENDGTLNIVDTENQIRKLVKHISVFSDRNQLIMPTNLVAFLLLYHFKYKKTITLLDMANVAHDVIKYLLSIESLAFEYTSVITNIRRGCNMLCHCMAVKMQSIGDNDVDCVLVVDWDNYSSMLDLDMYADIVVHKLLMRAVAATAFVTEARFSCSMEYSDQLSINSTMVNDSITNIVKILLSRYFQFLLPCESLDNEISTVNSWWNETMVSVTRETDAQHSENEICSDSQNWRADVYDRRVRDHILLLSRCLAPRFEALNFIVMELMRNKQMGFDSMILCSELYGKVVESIKKAGKNNQLRFKSSLNEDYFISGIITLTAHEMIRIFDITKRDWVQKPENVDLISSRYAILDSEYYNLQRWKTFIDLALIVA